MFHERISLNSVLVLLLVNIVSGFRLGSAACAATIVHRNYFFCLYQQNKSSEFKIKFRQASNHCKRVLELLNLHMLLKQKNPSLPRNLVLGTFGKLLTVFSTQVNLQYLLYSMA